MTRNRDSRTLWWAVLISILVHLAVAFSLAAFAVRDSSLPDVPDEKPIELTIVNLATPPRAVPKNAQFVDTKKKSAEAPKEKTFESNENSIAASEQPATGDSDLPSQTGKERPFQDIVNQQAALALEGTEPQPSVAPQPTPTPTATPTPALTPAPSRAPSPTPTQPPVTPSPSPQATPAPDQLAMLTSTPTPAASPNEQPEASPSQESRPPTPTPTPKPAEPASAYQKYREQTKVNGRITNRGASAVNALGTPLGRYQKKVLDGIGSRWNHYIKKQADLITIGTARVSFSIDREGHVENLKMNGNSSNESFANVCLQSVQEVKAPPIPPEVAEVLPPEGLIIEISFTAFAN